MKTVLICDDVKTDRDLIGKVVSDAGLRPVYATHGEEAIEMAKDMTPDLILLDVVMPKMDGFKACRVIKTHDETKNIPIVLVTSKNTAADQFWAKKQGADGHVGKPFTPAELENVLKSFVS